MSAFINDQIPPITVEYPRLLELIERVAQLWPSIVVFSGKEFSASSYTCRSIVPISRKVREKFEHEEWGEDEELAGIVMDFVGLALKFSSKYINELRPAQLDFEVIARDIEARDDLLVIRA